MSGLDRQQQDEIVAGERWLKRFETSGPSREGIERLNLAIRDELAVGAARPCGRRWATWYGVLGAAAALLAAVTIGWHSGREHGTHLRMAAGDGAASQWSIETQQDAVVLTDLDNDLSELEAWSSDESWELGGTSLYEAFEGVLEGASNGSPADGGASMGLQFMFDESEVA